MRVILVVIGFTSDFLASFWFLAVGTYISCNPVDYTEPVLHVLLGTDIPAENKFKTPEFNQQNVSTTFHFVYAILRQRGEMEWNPSENVISYDYFYIYYVVIVGWEDCSWRNASFSQTYSLFFCPRWHHCLKRNHCGYFLILLAVTKLDVGINQLEQ